MTSADKILMEMRERAKERIKELKQEGDKIQEEKRSYKLYIRMIELMKEGGFLDPITAEQHKEEWTYIVMVAYGIY